MRIDRLTDHQIKTEVTNREGVIRLRFSNGQAIDWPVRDETLPSGTFYLLLSSTPQLPTKEELARLVLKEILKSGQ